jgi:thiol:disulfide interchange protein DsbC
MNKQLLIAWAAAALLVPHAQADEAEIRAKLPQRLPDIPKIEDVRPAAIPGLYEVAVSGGEVLYSDEHGEYIIHGDLIQTKTMRNLTEERQAKLTQIDFNSLPLQDAVVWKVGSGKRRMAIFADPNCGYCKRLERDLQQLKDVTVYTFLIPILGGDSPQKAQNIWCSKSATQTYRDWMLDGVAPPRFMGMTCNTPLERNLSLARKLRVEATPALFFENGSRIRGAASVAEIEKRLSGSKS